MNRVVEIEREILHGHLFCGIGGGAVGFNRGSARVGSTRAKFVCVGGIDVDPASCRDFARNVGVPASCLDLFTLEQYVAFHGKAPPAAQAIANLMGETLLLAWSGVTFTLSAAPIWVRNVAVALSVKEQEMINGRL